MGDGAHVIGYAEREIHAGRSEQLYDLAVNLVTFYVPTWWLKSAHGWRLGSSANHTAELRCHEIARAVGAVLELEVVDGHYGRVEHSWLLTPLAWARDSGRPQAILDVYVPGRLPMVALVDPHFALPEAHGYTPGTLRDDIDRDLVDALVAQMMYAPLDRRERPR